MIKIHAIKNKRPDTAEEAQALLEDVKKAPSLRKYAEGSGIANTTLRNWIKRAKLLLQGFDVPEGQGLKGVSTLYDSEGNVKQRWVKTCQETEDAKDDFADFAQALQADITPIKKKDFKGFCNENLMTDYVISDFHLGQFSDESETGEAWDLGIAFDVLSNYIMEAIQRTPNSKQAVLTDLGDFLHADGLLPVTPASGHVLDASGRFRSVVDVATTLFVSAVDLLLEKHELVHIKICEGNHNLNSSYWQAKTLSAWYRNEPRVSVDLSHSPYYAFKWGRTVVFYHHGHLKRINQIASTMVSKFRDLYGDCDYAFCNVGHLHHKASKECSLMEVIQHQTLAAKDAYSSRGGYMSHRGAKVMTYHKTLGLVKEETIRPINKAKED